MSPISSPSTPVDGLIEAAFGQAGLQWWNGYKDRVRRSFAMTDMRTCLVTQAELNKQLEVLRDPDSYSAEELAYAKKVKSSMVHPDTGEIIFLPFRMSAQVPLNILIVAGMLTASSLPANLFFQWLNQSLNTCVNYANRNASNPMSTQTLVESYLGATGTAMATVLAMDKLVPRNIGWLRRLSPFVAVCAASAANVYLMRRNETVEGVTVYRQDTGQSLGQSVAAGQQAVALTSLTRISTATPVMLFPSLVYSVFNLHQRIHSKIGHGLANMALVGLGLFVFLPTTLAIFPQTVETTAGTLGLSSVPSDTRVYFNKGL